MWRILKEKRKILKVLRSQKKEMVVELRSRKQAKKAIEQQIKAIMLEIKDIKGSYRDL